MWSPELGGHGQEFGHGFGHACSTNSGGAPYTRFRFSQS